MKLFKVLGTNSAANELIAAGMYVCPKFDGKELEAINLDGTVNKWRIYCDHTVPEIDRRTQGWLVVWGPFQEFVRWWSRDNTPGQHLLQVMSAM
jgi:hypothetical protein